MTLIGTGAIVLDGQVCRPGWLQTSGRQILECGAGPPPAPADVDFSDSVVIPGFIDMHVHGGGGASYTDAHGIAAAAEFHLWHGTTTTLATLVTAGPAELSAGVRALSQATRDGLVAGIHLEGPWLSRARCGAHDPERMREPDPAEIDAVLAVGGGAVRMVTLAPELPGCDEAIQRLEVVLLSPLAIRTRPTSRPGTPSYWAQPSAPICSMPCHRCTIASRSPRWRCCKTLG